MPVIMTGQELCNYLKIERVLLWKLRKEGLPHLLVSQSIRYDLDSVMSWLSQRKEAS